MNMIFLMSIGIVIVPITIMAYQNSLKSNPIDNEYEKFDFILSYVAGSLKIFDVNVRTVLIISMNDIRLQLDKYDITIPYDKLLDYKLQTEEEIQQKITLGRLLIFGVFALGMKKSKKKTTKYIVLEFVDDNSKKQNVILQGDSTTYILEKIHKYKENKDKSSSKQVI